MPSSSLLSDVYPFPTCRLGEPTALGGDRPLPLDRDRRSWAVLAGYVDLFAAATDPALAGPRRHLARIPTGGMLSGFGEEAASSGVALSAVPGPGTEIAEILGFETAAETGALIEQWVLNLAEAVRVELPPRDLALVDAGEQRDGFVDLKLSVRQGVLWVALADGTLLPDDQEALALKPGSVFPLTPAGWVAEREATLRVMDTATALAEEAVWPALAAQEAFILARLADMLGTESRRERERLARRQKGDDAQVDAAIEAMVATINPERVSGRKIEDPTADGFYSCCDMVARAAHFALVPPEQRFEVGARPADVLYAISVTSQIRYRRVALASDWWRQEGDSAVGFLAEGEAPVALIRERGRYVMVDPRSGTRRVVDARVAGLLDGHAWVLYRPFPARKLKARDVLRYAFTGRLGMLFLILSVGVCTGLIGLALPLASEFVFNDVIPGAEFSQLWQIVAILIVGNVGNAAFQVCQSLAILRMQGRMDGEVQAAVWDRLLALPVSFFRSYTAGDLAMRAMGINSINGILTGTTLTSVFSGLFSTMSLGMMLWYDWKLALVGVLMVVVSVGIGLWITWLQLRFQRQLYALEGHLAGRVLQLISGIAKLRVTGAEPRAYADWAEQYAHQTTVSNQARVRGYFQSLFTQFATTASTIGLFFFIAHKWGDFNVGQFIAFNSAFGSFFGGMLGLVGALAGSMAVFPLYERAKPILDAVPEAGEDKASPGELTGRVDLDHIAFKYDPEGRDILSDVTISARPGEFIAIVGPSGAGKSTVFRLLMGFEFPTAGTVSYDGKDLKSLDMRSVRRQMGIVLQNGQLVPGSIFDNIVGVGGATLDDAWEAARMAGLEDDIKAMPMGMQTVISEGAATFSGGQRQRLLIARAVVGRPRVLLFDEATSALDNRTQKHVSDALDQLKATRIVIAHRLSTIVHADRIYVLRDGRVVQTGTYEDLVNQPGDFAELAKRQIA